MCSILFFSGFGKGWMVWSGLQFVCRFFLDLCLGFVRRFSTYFILYYYITITYYLLSIYSSMWEAFYSSFFPFETIYFFLYSSSEKARFVYFS